MLSTFEFVVAEDERRVFEIRDRETVVGSNGSSTDTEILWPEETKELQLELRAEVVPPEKRASAVNLAEMYQM